MTELFLKLVNMSISAGWLVLAVAVLRLFLRKAPKWLWPVLWGGVGIRLICPVSIESVLSLIPSVETVSPDIVYQSTPVIHSGVAVIDQAVNPIVGQTFAPASPVQSVNPLQIWVPALALIWAMGVCALLAGAAVSYVRLRRRVATAVRLRENIYQSEGADTPFVLGLFRPRIYLPFSLSEEQTGPVIAHEQAHIARKDHWIKPIGFLLLCVYWFDPLLWAAYALLCRDIELACDERVIRRLTAGQRADYSQALLSCSVPRRTLAVCPLAFGEVGVKERVKHVLNYKKPAFWLGAAAVVCCVIVAVCFLTDPPASAGDPEGQDGIPLAGEPAATASVTPSADPLAVEPSPTPEPVQTVPLTPENAQQTVLAILGTLRVEGQTISFTIPEELPVPEDENTELTITLNATWSYLSEPGTYSTSVLLNRETGWTAGLGFGCSPQMEPGWDLVKVMLRVAYMTLLDGNSFREYAANYVELTPPFLDVPVASIPMLEVVQDGREVTATYLLRGGSQFALSFTAPEGLTAAAEAPETVSAELFAPRVILTDGAGNQAGILSLYPIDGIDPELWDRVDPAENHLPMQIFAWRALANHAGYDGYTVVRHSSSGASATARWWRELPPYDVEDVLQEWRDCVLAYDWSAALCFAEFMLGDGTLTPDQLTALAESVTFR